MATVSSRCAPVTPRSSASPARSAPSRSRWAAWRRWPAATQPVTLVHAELLGEALDRSRSDALLVEALLDAQFQLSGGQPEVQAALHAWQAARERLWYRCEVLLRHLDDGQLDALPVAAAAVQREVDPALVAASTLTERLQAAASARSARQLRLLEGGVAATLLLLGLLALLVVEPTARAVRLQVRRLADQADELSRLALVAERTDNMVILSNAEREIVWINDAFTRLTGYTLDEVRGQRAATLLRSENNDAETATPPARRPGGRRARACRGAGAREGRTRVLDRRRHAAAAHRRRRTARLRHRGGRHQRAPRAAGAAAPRRAQRRADRAAQPRGGAGPAAARHRRTRAAIRATASRCCSWTSTASSRSTTRWATAPATSCCARSRAASRTRCARATPWRVWRRSLQTAARIGGDEFVVVLEGVHGADEARAVAERLLAVLAAALRHPRPGRAVQRQHRHRHRRPRRWRSADDVLRDADTAMYEAKRAGRGRCVVFDSSMHERVVRSAGDRERPAPRAARARAVRRLPAGGGPGRRRHAGARRLAGVEALVRWRHPDARRGAAGAVHRRGRGGRPHRRHRPAGAGDGLRAVRTLAPGPGRTGAAAAGGEPVARAAADRRAWRPRCAGCWNRTACSRTSCSWK